MNWDLLFRFFLLYILLFTISSYSQNFYRSVADKDSFAYVTMNDKILVLRHDQSNELEYVNSIPFAMNHNTNKFNSEVIINDYLLVSSLDSVVLFSILNRENPIEIDRIGLSNIFSLSKFGPQCIVTNNNSEIVLGIEYDSLVIKSTKSGGKTNYNPYFPEWNTSAISYPYFMNSQFLLKYNDINNEFNTIDTIKLSEGFCSNGVIANPDNNTLFVSFKACLGGNCADWYKFEIVNDLLSEGVYSCLYYCSSPMLAVQGITMKNFYGWGLFPGEGFKWFYSNNICEEFPFPLSIDPLIYPIAIDSLMYRIGSQGFYYQYQINNNGLVFHQFQLPVSIDDENNSVPIEMELEQNYPNPFNPETKIKYTLHKSSLVKINVYDVLGDIIKTIVDEMKSAGAYETTFNGTDLPSGMYFYNLVSEKSSITKKMMLIK